MVEVLLYAYADIGSGDADIFDTVAVVQPTTFSVVADGELVKSLDTKEKVLCELWSNGYGDQGNDAFNSPGRICFSVHSALSDHLYSGGYKMTLASNIQFFFTFAAAAYYKIVAVQYQKCKIDDAGVLKATLQ